MVSAGSGSTTCWIRKPPPVAAAQSRDSGAPGQEFPGVVPGPARRVEHAQAADAAHGREDGRAVVVGVAGAVRRVLLEVRAHLVVRGPHRLARSVLAHRGKPTSELRPRRGCESADCRELPNTLLSNDLSFRGARPRLSIYRDRIVRGGRDSWWRQR